MNIAEASLEELKYYFILAKDLGYTETSSERATAEEIGKMLHAYIATVNSRRS